MSSSSAGPEPAVPAAPPWARRRLVVFDMDGTLYRQRPLRRRMLRMLLADALRRRDLTTIRVLSEFRRRREAMAEARLRGFEPVLFAETAAACGLAEPQVRAIVRDWIEARPLPHLPACRVPGAAELFAALRRAGVAVGVLSDYPAAAKLAALGLEADHVLSATDPEVGVQKPDPRGLAVMLERAGCAPGQALMIGDRPERDGAAARALGVPFLRVARRAAGGAPSNDPVLADFTDSRLHRLWDGAP